MRSQIRKAASHALLVLMLLFAITAQGAILGTYTDRTTWEGLTTGRIDIDLESLGLGVGFFTNYSTVAGLTAGGLNFTGFKDGGWDLYAVNPVDGWGEDFDSGTILRGPQVWSGAGSHLTVIVPAATTSFGLDLMSLAPAGVSFSILLDSIDVGVVTVTQSRPNRTFFGVQTDTAFTEVQVVISSGGVLYSTHGVFDNFAYGAASGGGGDPPGGEVAEVTTLLYVGTGIGLLRCARRRRRAPRVQLANC